MSRITWWAPALLGVAGLMAAACQPAFAAGPGRAGGGSAGHSGSGGGHMSAGHSGWQAGHMGAGVSGWQSGHNQNHNHVHGFNPGIFGGYYPYLGYNSYYSGPDYYTPSYLDYGGPGVTNYIPSVPSAPFVQPLSRTTDSASIHVIVPDAAARVWFDGTLTTQTGTDRYFHTPDLKTSTAYNYQIRVVWMKDGRELSEERTVSVTPGQTTLVFFTR